MVYHLLPNDEYVPNADDSAFKMNSQISIDEKPDYYAFVNETATMAGEEVFAQFSKLGV